MTLRPILAALLFLFGAAPVAEAQTAPAPLTSLTSEFAQFADETAAVPEAERVARFKARFEPLLPGFYEARGRDPARYDAQIAKALSDFPAIRDKYDAAASDFTAAFQTATARFRRFFPDFEITMPVYLVHSLGEMDGGTRTIRGRNVAIFGADVIARIHDETTIPPFLDHELFHIYHARFFPDCDALWCSLWQEGLAVYVASQLDPGSSDRQLLLTLPRPIRPEVDAHFEGAICFTRSKLDSADPADSAAFFQGGSGPGNGYPPRFGYYIGYRIALKLGERIGLEELAKLPAARVRDLMNEALAGFAPCGGSG